MDIDRLSSMSWEELGQWFYDNDIASWIDLTCIYCGNEGIYTDHVIPKSRGGSNDRSNLVPCCAGCNANKGTQTPEEWIGIPNSEIYKGSPHHIEFAKKRMASR